MRLVRFKEFSVSELAPGLHLSASKSAVELYRRFSPGTIRRLGKSAVVAKNYLNEAIRHDARGGIPESGQALFAIIHDVSPEAGLYDILGAATASRLVPSSIHRFPLPPALTDKMPAKMVERPVFLGEVNVTGWMRTGSDFSLESVYRQLLDCSGEYGQAWTVEPLKTFGGARTHQAIEWAGMVAVGEPHRYDVGEDRITIPPVSQAYNVPVEG